MKILVVDDQVQGLTALSRFLRDNNYEVLEAGNGFQAIQILQEYNDIDILLTDYGMPEVTGDEVIQWTKEHKPGVKTILISGHIQTQEFAIQCGADAYIERNQRGCVTERILKTLQNIMQA